MKRIKNSSYLFQFLLISLVLVFLVVTYNLVKAGSAPNPKPPLAPDTTGNYTCITAGYACVAQDVKVKELVPVEILTPCDGVGSTATVRFRVMVEAAQPDRYDIGTFIALNGKQVTDAGATCYHDYYEWPLSETVTYGDFNGDTFLDLYKALPAEGFPQPPTPPWVGFWNNEPKDSADVCGDILNATQIFKIQDEPLDILCTDTINDAGLPNADGYVDVWACASWDNNAQSTCTGVAGAVPGT